jgi:ABC-type multidrug transport system fused ATPase/permease subunit
MHSSLQVLTARKISIESGQVMELICNDSQRFVTSGEWFIHMAVRHCLSSASIISWLLYFIGWQIIPGFLFLVSLVTVRTLFNKVDYDLRKKASGLSEERLGYIRESFTAIHSVKVNCWEKNFEDKIQKTRW